MKVVCDNTTTTTNIKKLYTSTPIYKVKDGSFVVAQLSGIDPYGKGQKLVMLRGDEEGVKLFWDKQDLSDIFKNPYKIYYVNDILITPMNPDPSLKHNFCYYGSPTTLEYVIIYAPGLILDYIASSFSPFAAGAMHMVSGSLTVALEHVVNNRYTWPDNPNLERNRGEIEKLMEESQKESLDEGGISGNGV